MAKDFTAGVRSCAAKRNSQLLLSTLPEPGTARLPALQRLFQHVEEGSFCYTEVERLCYVLAISWPESLRGSAINLQILHRTDLSISDSELTPFKVSEGVLFVEETALYGVSSIAVKDPL